MKRISALALGIGLFAGSGFTRPQATAAEPTVDIWMAAATGNLEAKSTGYRGSYFVNGEIHVNEYGTPEGKPLTSGHQDFKPSWSKTGDMLVFFRRLKDDPVVTNWKTQIHIINVDGTGLHPLTDKSYHTWAYTWLIDGRILVQCAHPQRGLGLFSHDAQSRRRTQLRTHRM